MAASWSIFSVQYFYLANLDEPKLNAYHISRKAADDVNPVKCPGGVAFYNKSKFFPVRVDSMMSVLSKSCII